MSRWLDLLGVCLLAALAGGSGAFFSKGVRVGKPHATPLFVVVSLGGMAAWWGVARWSRHPMLLQSAAWDMVYTLAYFLVLGENWTFQQTLGVILAVIAVGLLA